MLVEFNGATSYAVLVFRGTEQRIKDVVTDLALVTLPSNTGNEKNQFGETARHRLRRMNTLAASATRQRQDAAILRRGRRFMAATQQLRCSM